MNFSSDVNMCVMRKSSWRNFSKRVRPVFIESRKRVSITAVMFRVGWRIRYTCLSKNIFQLLWLIPISPLLYCYLCLHWKSRQWYVKSRNWSKFWQTITYWRRTEQFIAIQLAPFLKGNKNIELWNHIVNECKNINFPSIYYTRLLYMAVYCTIIMEINKWIF